MGEGADPLRRDPPAADAEAEALVAALERQRRIFAWKCGGLTAPGMRATAAASTMTLGGLVKHLAMVEDDMLSRKLLGNPPAPPWDSPGREADTGWDWRTAADDSPEELLALWRENVTRARANLRVALADGGLDRPTAYVVGDGEPVNLRRLLLHTIEEYARHVGHADLLRESVDGLVGEQPMD